MNPQLYKWLATINNKSSTGNIISQDNNVVYYKFAELCGLHRTYISDIECFRRSISLDNIQKISDALEIETYKLFLEE